MAASKKTELVEIRPIDIQHIKVRLIGDSPLVMHAWDAKAKRQILEKELGFQKTKEVKDPVGDFISSMYWLTPMPEDTTMESFNESAKNGARFGFPATAFKQAAIAAAFRMGWAKDKVSIKSAFFIEPTDGGYYAGDLEIQGRRIVITPNVYKPTPMVEIHSEPPRMREDMVRVGMGAADIRYRGEFSDWYAELTIAYNANGQYSFDQIVNMINAGGFACGVGEMRPERDGQNGMFHVAADGE